MLPKAKNTNDCNASNGLQRNGLRNGSNASILEEDPSSSSLCREMRERLIEMREADKMMNQADCSSEDDNKVPNSPLNCAAILAAGKRSVCKKPPNQPEITCCDQRKTKEEKEAEASQNIDLAEFLRRMQAEKHKQLKERYFPSTKEECNSCEDEDDEEDDGASSDISVFLGKNDDCNMLPGALKTAKSCQISQVTPSLLLQMERGYSRMLHSNSQSLLKRHLSRELFDELKLLKTDLYSATLMDCIRSGFENSDSVVGAYAADAVCYAVFEDLFDAIIDSFHCFKRHYQHPPVKYGNPSDFCVLDRKSKYVISVQIRCNRSLYCFPFAPCLTRNQYEEIEAQVKRSLLTLGGDFKGNYYSLGQLDQKGKQILIRDRIMPVKGDRFLESANALRFWPIGRGIYLNLKQNFIVWCNHTDHLTIISTQKGSDFASLYRRFVCGLKKLGKLFDFVRDERLGYLTLSPTNLGTAIKAVALVKFKYLAEQQDKLFELADQTNINIDNSGLNYGLYEVSNKSTIGLTEYEAVKELYDGLSKLIKMEKHLAKVEYYRKVLCEPSKENEDDRCDAN